MQKRRRGTGATSEGATPLPAVQPTHVTLAGPESVQPMHAAQTPAEPDAQLDAQAAQQQPAQQIDSQSSLPDNNTVTWAPLIMQVWNA